MLGITMFLQFYLNELGERVYTMKVRTRVSHKIAALGGLTLLRVHTTCGGPGVSRGKTVLASGALLARCISNSSHSSRAILSAAAECTHH